MERKIYSLPNSTIDYIKNEATKKELTQSDMLRRIIDFYKDNHQEK